MKRLIIFGSYNMDLSAGVSRFPTPGETLMGTALAMSPGGKGSNQAIAAHRAGAQPVFISRIGDDTFGQMAQKLYADLGIDASNMFVSKDEPTGSAIILVSQDTAQNMIVVNPGACSHFTAEDIAQAKAAMGDEGILLIQLETDLAAVEEMIKTAKERGMTVVLNPAPAAQLSDETLAMVDIISPNETETELLTGIYPGDIESCRQAALALMSRGVGKVVITLGSKGAYIHSPQVCGMVASFPAKAIDSTGAGDVFNGAMVTALAEGRDFVSAVRFGCAAASVSVSRSGAAMSAPFREEIDAVLKEPNPNLADKQ